MDYQEYHLPTDETAQRAAEALEKIAEHFNPPQPDVPVVEYGARWITGASDPKLERVTRQNGVIAAWDIELPQNVGGSAERNPFDDIDIFSPKQWADAAGNQFRRFSRFYVGEEKIGGYTYIWVCSTPVYSFYRLPRAFYRNGSPYWNYVDIGAYEGGSEVIGGQTYLCSKSGFAPMANMTRTEAHNRAKAWATKLGAVANNESYDITTMSEITEILQPLVMIMFGTKNSQNVYNGVCNSDPTGNYDEFSSQISEANTNRVLLNTEDGNPEVFPVGGCVWVNGSWRVIVKAEEATVSSRKYFEITVSGEPFNSGDVDIFRGPNATGETDKITATNGTAGNDGTHSFKALGIENIYGNVFKHILDCTVVSRVPYVCENLDSWTDTTTPASNSAFKKCDLTLPASGWITELAHDEAHPDINLPVSAGGSDSTYFGDYVYTSSGTNACTAFYGGSYGSGSYDGLAYWYLICAVGNSFYNFGARLSHRSL